MADKAGWYRFVQVTKYVRDGHKLYRSSAPNYVQSEGDKSQKLTSTSVQFLTSQKIDNIISFNQYIYTDSEKQLLKNANIDYLHLPIVDFSAPTLDQLHKAITSYKATNHKSTLVHCGYGHGRTGTGVTALQLDSTSGQNPPESEWESVNHVEEDKQIEVLRQLKKEYQKSAEL
ncbi:uncharacterized protein LAESUDRAFT_731705 [Laetiporus sulphureus 93-53]|uniref:Tyrosine specific protein phosphatases domain-containing protein n=1 Tax=Laetiporus sulphureus 93-53 TaxID=1314785 RepID=A0A165BG24_9APHY|nr:uncharacterized protein LAESUDRAFT_731705 [Laetiporus sulphureus 93-53]KZT00982.1 hypothetical protein LAESUDRAFT_731705 [Laetiporus sulphureus 93-53]